MPELIDAASLITSPQNIQPELTAYSDALRMPPYSVHAEQSLLGALMLDNEVWNQIADQVNAEDFYRKEHRIIFQAIAQMAEDNQPIDVVTLSENLERRSELDTIGGTDYLIAINRNTPTAINSLAYAKIIRETSILRQMISVGIDIANEAYQPKGREVTELLDAAERKVFEIADNISHSSGGFQPLKILLKKTLNQIETLFESQDTITGLATGYTDFDEKTSGLQPADLIIVAGRPSMGKTSYALGIAAHVAMKLQRTVAIFSLEMPAEALVMRLISTVGRINQQHVRTGQLGEDEWPRFTNAIKQMTEVPLFIDDTASLSPIDLRARARRLKHEQKDLALIVIDYLQLMQVAKTGENRNAEISAISRALKLLARELNVPVIALSQLNRSLEQRTNKRPVMSDLRECVTGDTRVILADGRPIPIRDLVGERPKLFSLDRQQRCQVSISDQVWTVGRKPVLEISLATGRSIRATANHLLLSGQGWITCDKLKTGDRVAIIRKIPEPINPEVWPKIRVILLGQKISSGRFYGKKIPEAAFRLADCQIAILLKHLWATDGTIVVCKNEKKGGNVIHFSTNSPQLASDVTLLLQRLGIIARIHKTQKQGYRPGYMVVVSGVEMQKIFLTQVGAFGPRVFQAEHLKKRLTNLKSNTNVDTIPNEIFDQIKKRMRICGISQRKMANLRGTSYGGSSHFKFAPSRSILAEYAKILDDDELRQACNNDLFWDRILEIKPDKVEEVFDLTVPDTGNWIANGIVSHNSGSLEQDADLIAFIYRDEVYNEESTDKGIAEIIISKQRNGPTGTVKLTFLGEYTKFENYSEAVYGAGYAP